MKRSLLLLLALIGSFSCLAEVVVQSRVATDAPLYAGQRVVLEIDALVAEGWVGIKKIELGEVEGAVVLNRNPAGITITEQVNGQSLSGQRKELWIYPQRAGTIVIPAFSMEVETRSWGAKASVASESVKMEALTFDVVVPKGVDANAQLISATSLKASQQWSGAEEKGVVGDAVTRTITIVADDLPGMLLPPLTMEKQDGLGLYSKQPLLDDTMDRGELVGKRQEAVSIVFEAPGSYRIPDLSFQWFDLNDQTLKTEVLEGRTFLIAGAPAPLAEPMPSSTRWWIGALLLLIAGGIWWADRRLYPRFLASEWMAFRRVRRSVGSDSKAFLNAVLKWGDRVKPDFRLDSFLAQYGGADADAVLNRFYKTMGKENYALLKTVSMARRNYLKKESTSRRERKLLPPLNP